MTLEQLNERKAQLEVAIANQTQSVYMLQGHKAEVDFQISELMKIESETKVDEPSVNEDAPVVE